LMLCTVGPTHLATAAPAGAPAGCCGNNVSDSRLNRRNALTALGSGKLQQNDARMNSVSKNIESLPGPDKEANQPGNRHRLPPPCSEGAYYSRSLALALSLSLSPLSYSHPFFLHLIPLLPLVPPACLRRATSFVPGHRNTREPRALSLSLAHSQYDHSLSMSDHSPSPLYFLPISSAAFAVLLRSFVPGGGVAVQRTLCVRSQRVACWHGYVCATFS
jgi:hypothetical protein